MKVKVHMLSQSQPVEFIKDNVTNTYTKDGLFCIYIQEENKVYKYPLCNIFVIKEDYN